jgi:high-affinity Fe2+/Pb2+ permease
MNLVCYIIAAVIFLLLGVKVDLGDAARWDFVGLFFVALGLALGGTWPAWIRRP